MVLGLLRFTRQEDALFLLDEPDTHLNPIWSVQYLDLLDKIVGEQKSSHIIITTHNPLTILGLLQDQLRIFMRDDETNGIYVEEPFESPKGTGIANILTNIFNSPILDQETQGLLNERRKLAAKEELSGQERERLMELGEQLQDTDIVATRDPLYQKFLSALFQHEQRDMMLHVPTSSEELERQRKIAQEIVEKIKEENS
jgi:ABC-type multidrug transport system ATPase subunit